MTAHKLNTPPRTVTQDVASAVSLASGITLRSAKLSTVGKLAQLELWITHSSAWTVGTQYSIGTLTAHRPASNTSGFVGTMGIGLLIAGNGNLYARPLANAEVAAGSSTYVRFTYLLA
jgi:hypothetical protein